MSDTEESLWNIARTDLVKVFAYIHRYVKRERCGSKTIGRFTFSDAMFFGGRSEKKTTNASLL